MIYFLLIFYIRKEISINCNLLYIEDNEYLDEFDKYFKKGRFWENSL